MADAALAMISLQDLMAKEPGALVEKVAKEHNTTPRAVVEALPDAMRTLAPGSAFIDVMKDIGSWGDLTVIIHTEDGVFEVSSAVPAGEVGHGYYNIPGSSAFHGHLRHERCTGIAFVERPTMGRSSASVLFFNPEGNVSFKIFVGRDENRELKADQIEKFRALAKRVEG
jgi:putative heme utilization carrier protein HutX